MTIAGKTRLKFPHFILAAVVMALIVIFFMPLFIIDKIMRYKSENQGGGD
jgi:hypothetical protein